MSTQALRYFTDGKMVTALHYRDIFGAWVPLLDHRGKPVNYEGRPGELSHAMSAMATMDRLYGKGAS